MDIAEATCWLRILLDEAVKGKKAEGVLLSGGLDTSIIALLAKRHVDGLKAFTVTLEGFDEDLKYARQVASFLELELKVHLFTEKELREAAAEAAAILSKKEYEAFVPPHIRGSIIKGYTEEVGPTTFAPTYIAMSFAKRHVSSVYSGEGADELFLGYNSIASFIDFIGSGGAEPFSEGFVSDLERELSSTVFRAYDLGYPYLLARALDLEVKAPYLSLGVSQFASLIPVELKVRSWRGKVWGKWVLRKAFEEYLPAEILWREKTTIDWGTGSVGPLLRG